jgi:hypothetical protein
MPRFYEYEGDLMGLAQDDNHLVFRWIEPGCKVLFSIARLGDGASCHFASDTAGMRKLKQAINEFCNFLFRKYDWCTMVLAKVNKPSVGRTIKKCGFVRVGSLADVTAYARCKSWGQ